MYSFHLQLARALNVLLDSREASPSEHGIHLDELSIPVVFYAGCYCALGRGVSPTEDGAEQLAIRIFEVVHASS